MSKTDLPHKPHKKFRILLDAAFAKPEAFPKLCKKANVAHVVLNLGLSPQVADEEIYQKAVENNRFVVTINFNDFRNLVKRNKPGALGIPSQLTNAEIDELLSKFVSDNTVEECIGKAIKI